MAFPESHHEYVPLVTFEKVCQSIYFTRINKALKKVITMQS